MDKTWAAKYRRSERVRGPAKAVRSLQVASGALLDQEVRCHGAVRGLLWLDMPSPAVLGHARRGRQENLLQPLLLGVEDDKLHK